VGGAPQQQRGDEDFAVYRMLKASLRLTTRRSVAVRISTMDIEDIGRLHQEAVTKGQPWCVSINQFSEFIN